MSLLNRRKGALALVGALAVVSAIAPSIGSAKSKTYKVSWTILPDKGVDCSAGCAKAPGLVKGKPKFFNGRVLSVVTPPITKDTYTLKGGKLKLTWKSSLNGTQLIKTSGKFTSGTGKFKGAKGKVTKVTGDIAHPEKGFKFVGTITLK